MPLDPLTPQHHTPAGSPNSPPNDEESRLFALCLWILHGLVIDGADENAG
jgi:hypothetical protein